MILIGSFATVYKVIHKKSNIVRALKIIDKGTFFTKFVENEFDDVDEKIKKEFDLLRSLVYIYNVLLMGSNL